MPRYSELPPPVSLARWVECGWVLEDRVSITGHRVPPDGCVDVIYDRRAGLQTIGTMTVEQRFDFPDGAWLAGVRFRPGMAGPFLGISLAQLTDGAAPLEDLRPRRARELTRQLDDSESTRDALRILLAGLRPPAQAPNPVQRALEAIAAAHGRTGLDGAARHANLSPRQFRRRCIEESGLAPKLLCRVLRFRHACRLAREAGRPNWSAVALEAGYFDQAHFIRDFHQFTGVAPLAVFSKTGPALLA